MSDVPRYLDPKTLERIKRLEVRARLVVEGFLTGQHKSPFHGFAVEFAGHREYAPGDEIRHVDWKVWSKTDRLYIKQYEEETNLRCHLIVDASRSMRYGETTKWSKFDHAATAAASLAYLVQQQQDAVGLTLFSTKIEKALPPSASPDRLKRLLAELEAASPDAQTDVAGVFTQLAGQIKQRGLVVLFSDLFVEPATLAEALKQFRLRRHDVAVMHVLHEDELTFPFQDRTLFRGLESVDQLHVEPRALRTAYLAALDRRLKELRKTCATLGVDYVQADTGKPLDAVLAGYLESRRRMRRRAAKPGAS